MTQLFCLSDSCKITMGRAALDSITAEAWRCTLKSKVSRRNVGVGVRSQYCSATAASSPWHWIRHCWQLSPVTFTGWGLRKKKACQQRPESRSSSPYWWPSKFHFQAHYTHSASSSVLVTHCSPSEFGPLHFTVNLESFCQLNLTSKLASVIAADYVSSTRFSRVIIFLSVERQVWEVSLQIRGPQLGCIVVKRK